MFHIWKSGCVVLFGVSEGGGGRESLYVHKERQ